LYTKEYCRVFLAEQLNLCYAELLKKNAANIHIYGEGDGEKN